MKHWYKVEAFDERTDFFGEKRIEFKFHMDLENAHDWAMAREVAMNKIFADIPATYEDVQRAAIVLNVRQA